MHLECFQSYKTADEETSVLSQSLTKSSANQENFHINCVEFKENKPRLVSKKTETSFVANCILKKSKQCKAVDAWRASKWQSDGWSFQYSCAYQSKCKLPSCSRNETWSVKCQKKLLSQEIYALALTWVGQVNGITETDQAEILVGSSFCEDFNKMKHDLEPNKERIKVHGIIRSSLSRGV